MENMEEVLKALLLTGITYNKNVDIYMQNGEIMCKEPHEPAYKLQSNPRPGTGQYTTNVLFSYDMIEERIIRYTPEQYVKGLFKNQLVDGKRYYIPSIAEEDLYISKTYYSDTPCSKRLADLQLFYETSEEAKAVTKACFGE